MRAVKILAVLVGGIIVLLEKRGLKGLFGK